jgi:hypothetical protein
MRSLKLAITFVVGIAVGAAAVGALGGFWIYPEVAKEKFEYGRSLGAYNEQLRLAREIPRVLGNDIDPNEPKQYFFSGKDESVVIVRHNGIKTLRLCCDGTEPKPHQ